jgi:hypothetical protein
VKVRQDIYGIAEVHATRDNERVPAVQSTTTPNLAARMAKQPAMVGRWLSTGNLFVFQLLQEVLIREVVEDS